MLSEFDESFSPDPRHKGVVWPRDGSLHRPARSRVPLLGDHWGTYVHLAADDAEAMLTFV